MATIKHLLVLYKKLSLSKKFFFFGCFLAILTAAVTWYFVGPDNLTDFAFVMMIAVLAWSLLDLVGLIFLYNKMYKAGGASNKDEPTDDASVAMSEIYLESLAYTNHDLKNRQDQEGS
jgi:hypothetical protein